eukprot:GFYU01010630.1.p1 GENE.GFYU01010630.1~~GFYU01010630.1.p1  ORF type:complete len:407 (+),score=79.63 GFYU01010630.1:110-1330(+)
MVLLEASAVGVCAAYLAYRRQTATKYGTRIEHHDNLRDFVSKCNVIQSGYLPTVWAPSMGGVLHTVLGTFRLVPEINYRREVLQMPDGGTVALDWSEKHVSGDHTHFNEEALPVVIVFHGLTGSSEDTYVKHLVDILETSETRMRAVVFNYRGCGDNPLTVPMGYNAAFTADAHRVVDYVKSRHPRSSLFAIGVSLGSLILTKYIAECGDRCPLTAGVSISNPFCMATAMENLEKGINRKLNTVLASRLKDFTVKYRGTLEQHPDIDVDHILQSQTIRELEQRSVCPMYGYQDEFEYYQDGSSVNYIPSIRIPYMFLNAQDDPFLGYVPWEMCRNNPNVLLVVTKTGGHVAFPQGLAPFNKTFMDHACLDFFKNVMEHPHTLPDRETPGSEPTDEKSAATDSSHRT